MGPRDNTSASKNGPRVTKRNDKKCPESMDTAFDIQNFQVVL